jgi:hypothetical protein
MTDKMPDGDAGERADRRARVAWVEWMRAEAAAGRARAEWLAAEEARRRRARVAAVFTVATPTEEGA